MRKAKIHANVWQNRSNQFTAQKVKDQSSRALKTSRK